MNKGTNLRIKLKLSLKDISEGITGKKIKVKRYIKCEACNGTGAADSSAVQTCASCRGTGHVTRISNTFLGQMQTTSVCPHCGGEAIARGLRLNQNAEAGWIGLPYRAVGIFTGTEPLLVDLCETCGTVLRCFVKEPQRKWTP